MQRWRTTEYLGVVKPPKHSDQVGRAESPLLAHARDESKLNLCELWNEEMLLRSSYHKYADHICSENVWVRNLVLTIHDTRYGNTHRPKKQLEILGNKCRKLKPNPFNSFHVSLHATNALSSCFNALMSSLSPVFSFEVS